MRGIGYFFRISFASSGESDTAARNPSLNLSNSLILFHLRDYVWLGHSVSKAPFVTLKLNVSIVNCREVIDGTSDTLFENIQR